MLISLKKYTKLFAPACLLAGLSVLASCNPTDPLNEDWNLTEEESSVQTTEVAIDAKTLLLDSVKNEMPAYAKALTGSYSSSGVGNLTATSYFGLTPPSEGFVLDAGLTYDSMEAIMPYDAVYGQRSGNFTFSVHELEDSIKVGETYLNDKTIDYNTTAWATQSFNINGDSGGVSFLLNDLGAAIAALSSPDDFAEKIKGLALVPDASAGSVVGFDVNEMRFILHASTATGNDTTFTFRGNNIAYFTNIAADRSTTAFDVLVKGDTVNSRHTDNKVMLQAAAGVVPVIEFPFIEEWRKDPTKIISRAELYVYTTPDYATDDLSTIILFDNSEENRSYLRTGVTVLFRVLNDNFLERLEFDYDQDEQAYVMNISTYINQVLYESRENRGLIMGLPNFSVSADFTTYRYNFTVPSADHAVFYGPNSPVKKMKLKIYYSNTIE